MIGRHRMTILNGLLHDSANQLQVLILTCHPERYQGIGEAIEIRSE